MSCFEGLKLYFKLTEWDAHLRGSDCVQKAYQKNPKLSRTLGMIAAVPIGLIKTATDPLISLIAAVVFPIIALIRNDRTYLFASASAMGGFALMVGLALLPFFYSPHTFIDPNVAIYLSHPFFFSISVISMVALTQIAIQMRHWKDPNEGASRLAMECLRI